jgi:membrane protein DedA with SNARE-associated domain
MRRRPIFSMASHHPVKHHEISSTFRNPPSRQFAERAAVASSRIWNLKKMEFTSLSDVLISLIPSYGPWIIFGIVALESAGVPLPGETILIAGALLAATTGQINIVAVVLAAAAGAIVGDGMGYVVGRQLGLPFLRRYGRYIRLDEDRLLIGRYLLFQYGSAIVFFGRFIAVLRMFAALLAGANCMPAGRFFFFNMTGGICWACVFGFGAYRLGAEIYKISGTLSVISLGLFIAAGYALSIFIRRNEATLRRRAEIVLSDHSVRMTDTR